MDILIIGGGVFLGAAIVESALADGHRLAVFNRGRSRAAWPEGVEAIFGERSADLRCLQGRRFDAVIDTCGFTPAEVRASAEALRDSGCYCFVSSISAYASFQAAPVSESDALASALGIDPGDRDERHYGAQKAACEKAVEAVFGDRALVVRPGLIVGPRDPTGRFSHFPWRALEGGEMVVPAAPADQPLQFIDVRDLGEWIVAALRDGRRGSFNATGPVAGASSWAELLAACRSEAARRGAVPAQAVAVAESLLLAAGVRPWSALPLWLPSSDFALHAFARVDVARAAAAGFRTRPLHETVAAVMDEGVPEAGDPRRAGRLGRERELAIVAGWREARAVRPESTSLSAPP